MQLLRTFALLSAAMFIASTAYSQGDAGCMASGCHSDIGKMKWVHGPVGAGICTVCHNLVEGEDHEFTLAAQKDDLCWLCHETSRDMMLQEHLHTPVASGDCTGCHDPHETDFRFSLKGRAADLCFNCHDRSMFEKEHVHGPVGVGDCNACHNPHASPHPEQLLASREELCFLCHEEQVGMLEKRHVHSPVATDCSSCHNPHSSSAGNLLPEDPPGLCYGCHGELAAYETVERKHEPVASGECDQCHNAHSSENPRLFPVSQDRLCFACHTDLEEYVAASDYRHGPVEDGDCNACHDPHGSAFHRILRQYFPEEFYMPYAQEYYASCFECHNSEIAVDELTSTLTDFRDDQLNLHFLHVNKEIKGRTCRACHQVHASTQRKHVRTSVPFGKINWDLPIVFTKTENGGTCVVGCHAPKEYKRK